MSALNKSKRFDLGKRNGRSSGAVHQDLSGNLTPTVKGKEKKNGVLLSDRFLLRTAASAVLDR